MAAGSRMEAGAFLAALSWLSDGATVPAGERWDGVPARAVGAAPPAPESSLEPPRPSAWHATVLLAAKALVAQVAFLPGMALAAVVLSAWGGGAHPHCAPPVSEPPPSPGNHAVIPAGARLPGRILLGVCTVADPERIRPDSAWFGHPAFELPRREQVAADERLTFHPSPLRVAN